MPIKISCRLEHLVSSSLKNGSLTHTYTVIQTSMRWAGMMADGTMDAKVGQIGTKVTDEGNLSCGMAQDLRKRQHRN